MRNLKAFGLIAVLMLLVGLQTSTASAATFTFGKDKTQLTANQLERHEWTITSQSIACATFSIVSLTESKVSEKIKLFPVYTNCEETTSKIAVKVTGFGHYGETAICAYLLHAGGTFDLICDPGAEVTLDMGPCTVHIPAQNGLGKVTYTNGLGDIKVSFEVTNMFFKHTDGFLCAFEGGGEIKNGSFKGSSTLEGEEPGTNTSVSVSWDA